MTDYQHVFFDLDHTLWDFETNSKKALALILDELLEKRSFSFDEFYINYVKENAACWKLYRQGLMDKDTLRVKRFADALEAFGLRDLQLAQNFADKYLEISPYQTQLMPGALSLLNYLKQKGYHLHIITNGFQEVQSIKMSECGLAPFFDQIIISEHLQHRKPHPSVFRFALEKANAHAANSLMVGDHLEADILGAMRVGIDGIFFNPHSTPCHEKVAFEVQNLIEIKDIL